MNLNVLCEMPIIALDSHIIILSSLLVLNSKKKYCIKVTCYSIVYIFCFIVVLQFRIFH